jgi:hypothetical protein
MKQWYNHNDLWYIIHHTRAISKFTNKNGTLNMDVVKEFRDYYDNVDHVLKTDTHFLFVETIQDAEIVEDLEIKE